MRCRCSPTSSAILLEDTMPSYRKRIKQLFREYPARVHERELHWELTKLD